ncbi:MAG: T9SS type A sorting domain-containing protein, partial [Bacteroidota bacterium]|nr:T9SS type A sorting domain-containing protein [Bacteroidota bacterium]
LFFSAKHDVCAQWKNVAPSLLGPSGALHYKEGILWAGFKTLWSSSDLGKTWKKNNLSLFGTVTSIYFFDRNNGAVGASSGDVYLTSDGGFTWRTAMRFVATCRGVCYGASKNDIAVCGISPAMAISRDAGNTWDTLSDIQGSDWAHDIFFRQDLGLVVLASEEKPPVFAHTYISSDFGGSWQMQSGGTDYDTYSMTYDSCNNGNTYVLGEDYAYTQDHISKIFVSADNGNSWITTTPIQGYFFAGAIQTGPSTVYALTLKNGVYRSTDNGNTWKTIGGPNFEYDTRFLTVVDDNTLFVCAGDGSIWATFNSGGDSVRSKPKNAKLSFSEKTLFANDTIPCNGLVRFSQIFRQGCGDLSITNSRFSGRDSLSYSLLSGTDSIGVDCSPRDTGQLNANLILTLSDGSSDTILLGGLSYGRNLLSLVPTDQTTDTIGGSVNVPISITGLNKAEDIELVLKYDKELNYHGSFTPANTQLDIPGESWRGRSKLHISQAKPNTILGYARFDVFSDSQSQAHVAFDSVVVLTASPCDYIIPVPVTSLITTPSGCGIQAISRFIHDGSIPQLTLVPNPTVGETSIATTGDIGEVTISVFDILGTLHSQSSTILGVNHPAKLALPSANGVYNVRVRGDSRAYDLRVVVRN